MAELCLSTFVDRFDPSALIGWEPCSLKRALSNATTSAPGARPMRIEKKIRFRGNSEFASFRIQRTYKMHRRFTNQTKENEFFRKFLNKSKTCSQLLRELELKFREKIKMFQTLDQEFYLQFRCKNQKYFIGRVLNFKCSNPNCFFFLKPFQRVLPKLTYF